MMMTEIRDIGVQTENLLTELPLLRKGCMLPAVSQLLFNPQKTRGGQNDPSSGFS